MVTVVRHTACFWTTMPRVVVMLYRHFGRTNWSYLKGKESYSLRNSPEEFSSHLRVLRSVNLKYHTVVTQFTEYRMDM